MEKIKTTKPEIIWSGWKEVTFNLFLGHPFAFYVTGWVNTEKNKFSCLIKTLPSKTLAKTKYKKDESVLDTAKRYLVR